MVRSPRRSRKAHPGPAAPQASRRGWQVTARRSGFTIVELLASTTIVSILMLGLGAIVFLPARTLDSRNSVVAQRALSGEVVNDIADDLRHAIRFSDRGSKAFEVTVPDRTGDLLPETVRYQWSGNAGDSLLYSINGSPLNVLTGNVRHFQLDYLQTSIQGLQPPPIAGTRILYVVRNPALLTSLESGRKTFLEERGYAVTVIDDAASQAAFDTAVQEHDAAYVSHDADAAMLAHKLTATRIGVVAEHGEVSETLGFTRLFTTEIWRSWVEIISDDHYITSDFPVASRVAVLNSNQVLEGVVTETWYLGSGYGGDNHNLARTTGYFGDFETIVTLEPGDMLASGGEAAGRRVHLPWGGVDMSRFTGDGKYLLERAIAWAAGAGENSPRVELLLVVMNSDNLSSQEQQRKTLLQEWGYKVATIAAAGSQSEYSNAMADADVVFVPCHIPELVLGNRLRAAPIGVVNAANELHSEIGLYSGQGQVQTGQQQIEVIDKRHYITQPLTSGNLPVFTSSQPMSVFSGNLGSARVLATAAGTALPALAVLEAGQPMMGSDSATAPSRRVYLPWGGQTSFQLADLDVSGRRILQRSLEWAAGADAVIPEALCIVADADSLSASEQDRRQRLEASGYSVTLLSGSAAATEFSAAAAAADVVYVCGTVSPLDLGSKLPPLTAGIVTENADQDAVLGFCESADLTSDSAIVLSARPHYITGDFTPGQLEILTTNGNQKYLTGSTAAGLQTLALASTNAARRTLTALAAGQLLQDGSPAAGRRVSVPWNSAVRMQDLTADAVVLLERSLEWAAGSGDDGTPDAAVMTAGFQEIFAATETVAGRQTVAMQIALPEPGMFHQLGGYFDDQNSALRFAVYSDVGGEPGNLLAQSESVNPPDPGPQWVSAGLPALNLPPGTYWLAVSFSDSQVLLYHTTDQARPLRFLDRDAASNEFPTSWGRSGFSRTGRLSVFGTYTPQ